MRNHRHCLGKMPLMLSDKRPHSCQLIWLHIFFLSDWENVKEVSFCSTYRPHDRVYSSTESQNPQPYLD